MTDSEVAKELKLTEPGCIYLIKPTHTPFEDAKPNLSIGDYPFVQKLLLTRDQMSVKSASESYRIIKEIGLNKPQVVTNTNDIGSLMQGNHGNKLIVYCDPEVHGYRTYDEVIRSMTATNKMRHFSIKEVEESQKGNS